MNNALLWSGVANVLYDFEHICTLMVGFNTN